MRLLVDTHLLIWMTSDPGKLSRAARDLLEDTLNEISFSAVSIWEAMIRFALGKPDLTLHPQVLLNSLQGRDFSEVPLTAGHGLAVSSLPSIHADPFDRILIAQAQIEGLTLLTADRTIARYPGSIMKV